MKYLTKEWCETAQRTGLHFGLQPIDEARNFSEELFQRLYAEKEQEYLDSEKRVCDVNIEDLADGFSDAPIQSVDGSPITEEELNAAAAFQQALAKALREAPKMIFDPEKAKQEYHRRYLSALENIQRRLLPKFFRRFRTLEYSHYNMLPPKLSKRLPRIQNPVMNLSTEP